MYTFILKALKGKHDDDHSLDCDLDYISGNNSVSCCCCKVFICDFLLHKVKATLKEQHTKTYITEWMTW